MIKKSFDLEEQVSRNQAIIVDSALNYTGTVDWTRAISLVVAQEATILIPRTDGSMVRSTYLTMPRPLVVSLQRYVGTRIRQMTNDDKTTKSMVLIRDNWTCAYGDNEHYGDTIDHVQPKSRGGLNTWGNMVACCHEHNEMKGNKTLFEMGWKQPVIPKIFSHRRSHEIQNAIYQRLETMDSTPRLTLLG